METGPDATRRPAHGAGDEADALRRALAEREAELEQLRERIGGLERVRREEHREHEERYRQLFETMTQGVAYQSADGAILDANPAAQQILGLTLDQMQGRTSSDPRWRAVRADGSDFPGDQHPAIVALRTGRPVRDVLMGVFNPLDASYRWISISAVPLTRPGEHAPYQVYTTFDDITARRAAEESRDRSEALLRQSEAQYRYLFEHSPQPMWAYDEETLRFLAVNDAAVDKYGYSRAEFLGMTILDIRPPEERAGLLARLATRRPPLSPASVWVHQLKDGSQIDVEVTSHTIELGGRAARLVQVQDITARLRAEAQLHQSEESFATIFELSPIALGTARLSDGAITTVNAAYLRLYGYRREEMLGRTTLELGLWASPEDRERVMAQLHDAGRIADLESLAVTAAGERRGVLLSAEVVAFRGEPHVLMQVIDITALKEAQEALVELNRTLEDRVRQRAAEVQDLYENAPTGYYSLDADGRVTRVNETLLGWLGYERGEVLGRPFTDLIPAEHREIFVSGFEAFKRQGRLRGQDGTLLRRDGGELPVLLSATAIYDAGGAYLSSRATIFDNTDRKQAEDALRESEAQNRLLFEETPEAVALFDQRERIVRANRAFAQLVGMPAERLLGQTLDDLGLVAPEQRAQITLDALLVRSHDSGAGSSATITRADGARRAVAVRSFPVAIGGQRHYLAALHDLTLERQTEEALRMANRELARAAQAKDEFLANMSHELRTPLNAILGFSEILQEQIYGVLNESQRRAIGSIEAGGRHLLRLINDILDLAKIGAGRLELQIERTLVQEVCQSSVLLVQEQAIKKQLQLTMSLGDERAIVEADPVRLKQMLVNLLSNAVKFTPAGGAVTLEVRLDADAGAATFAVRDTGIGIAAADLGRLFRPFNQLDSALNREHEGTGLGLALVRRLAELHGGSVSVESEPGRGSCFTIALPYGGAASDTLPDPAPARPAQGRAARAGAAPLVLLAEDNPANVEALADYLQAKGYAVGVARTGYEAVAMAQDVQPAIIVMDIQMPGMDGLEAIRRIRAEPELASTPVVALTALAMPGDRERCLEAGASAYMTKPVKLRALAEVIEQLLST